MELLLEESSKEEETGSVSGENPVRFGEIKDFEDGNWTTRELTPDSTDVSTSRSRSPRTDVKEET